MANQSSVRFDHREIAVIFSLFVFVSLLMFTVGILVGKGLSQTANGHGSGPEVASLHPNVEGHPTGTSVTTGHSEKDHSGKPEHNSAKEEDPHNSHDATASHHTEEAGHTPEAARRNLAEEPSPLELVPEKPKMADPRGGLQEFPKTAEVEEALKNPKLQGVFEGSAPEKSGHGRNTASITKNNESYTVQVGSYPTQREANERVAALQKLGFPNASVSATHLNSKDTWYRVWLGQFPSAEAAKKSGELLQSRGEVKNYLVRRSDSKD